MSTEYYLADWTIEDDEEEKSYYLADWTIEDDEEKVEDEEIFIKNNNNIFNKKEKKNDEKKIYDTRIYNDETVCFFGLNCQKKECIRIHIMTCKFGQNCKFGMTCLNGYHFKEAPKFIRK